jgi:hypothetical protein
MDIPDLFLHLVRRQRRRPARSCPLSQFSVQYRWLLFVFLFLVPTLANLLVFDLELELLLKTRSLIPSPTLPRLIPLLKLPRLKGYKRLSLHPKAPNLMKHGQYCGFFQKYQGYQLQHDTI